MNLFAVHSHCSYATFIYKSLIIHRQVFCTVYTSYLYMYIKKKSPMKRKKISKTQEKGHPENPSKGNIGLLSSYI